MSCSEAGGSILCQRGGTRIPPCAPFEDWDAEDASEPGRAGLGTVGVGSGPYSAFGRLSARLGFEGELGIFAGNPLHPGPGLDWPSEPGKW